MLGKKSAMATPTRALAARRFCSARRISGRRSSSADGQTGGDFRRQTLLQQSGMALDRAGIAPEKHVDLVFLEHNLALQLRHIGGNCAEIGLGGGGFQFGSGAALETLGKKLQSILEGLGASFGDVQCEIQLQQFEIGLGHAAHQGNHHAPPRFLGGQELRQGGFIQAADAAPEVDFPEHAQIQQGGTLGLAAIGAGGAQEAVLAGGDGAIVTDLGKELGTRLGGDLPGLFHAAHGDAQVVVVGQRLTDELLEPLILKDLPPGEVGKASLIRDVGALRN